VSPHIGIVLIVVFGCERACTVPDPYEFVRAENIKAFQRQLETETDPARRKLLMQLLEEEKAGKLSPPPPGTDWPSYGSA